MRCSGRQYHATAAIPVTGYTVAYCSDSSSCTWDAARNLCFFFSLLPSNYTKARDAWCMVSKDWAYNVRFREKKVACIWCMYTRKSTFTLTILHVPTTTMDMVIYGSSNPSFIFLTIFQVTFSQWVSLSWSLPAFILGVGHSTFGWGCPLRTAKMGV